MTTYYCEGFIFSEDYKEILLIRKNRPTKLAGMLNGIGGHVEESDEHAHNAMIRETQEETGLFINNWDYFCNLQNPVNETEIHFYIATYPNLEEAQQLTDEELVIRSVDNLEGVVPNLKWLINLALDRDVVYGHQFVSHGKF